MPVVVRRQDTGALVQRFVFPATIADVSLRLDGRGALLATSRVLWALARPAAGSVAETCAPALIEHLVLDLPDRPQRGDLRVSDATATRETPQPRNPSNRSRATTWPPWSG